MNTLESSRVFVVQYRSDSEPEKGKILGRVEHIPSGQSVKFASQADIDAFVARILREEARPAGSSDPPGSAAGSDRESANRELRRGRSKTRTAKNGRNEEEQNRA